MRKIIKMKSKNDKKRLYEGYDGDMRTDYFYLKIMWLDYKIKKHKGAIGITYKLKNALASTYDIMNCIKSNNYIYWTEIKSWSKSHAFKDDIDV